MVTGKVALLVHLNYILGFINRPGRHKTATTRSQLILVIYFSILFFLFTIKLTM